MSEFKEYITFVVNTKDGDEVEMAVIDQFEFERYSEFYHEDEEKEEEKELRKEDRDSLLDIFAASFTGITVASRFPEKKKEEEHSLGSKLQELVTGDLGEGFGDPGFDRGEDE